MQDIPRFLLHRRCIFHTTLLLYLILPYSISYTALLLYLILPCFYILYCKPRLKSKVLDVTLA